MSGFFSTPVQPLDSDLTAIAALSTTAAGLALLDDADATAQRTTMGAVGLTGNETVAGAKTFSDRTVISRSSATTFNEYLVAAPTDLGVGKPYLYLAKSTSAAEWIFGLWDTASGAGTIAVSCTTLDVQGQLRCDTLRIDAAPASAIAVSSTHKIRVDMNGTLYDVLAIAA